MALTGQKWSVLCMTERLHIGMPGTSCESQSVGVSVTRGSSTLPTGEIWVCE